MTCQKYTWLAAQVDNNRQGTKGQAEARQPIDARSLLPYSRSTKTGREIAAEAPAPSSAELRSHLELIE